MRALGTVISIAALVATGCAALPSQSDAPPAFSAGALRNATRAVRGDDLVRGHGTEATYLVIEGDRAGTELIQRVVRDGVAVTLREVARGEDGGETPTEDMRMSTAADGTLVLHEVLTHTERSASVFADGLPFARPLLPPAASVEGTSPMRVYTLPARSPRGSGTARRSLHIAGETEITLGRERLEASVLDLVFDVELDVAKAHVTSRLFVVPGRGVVAEQRTERLRVLGLFTRTTVEHAVLTRLEHAPSETRP